MKAGTGVAGSVKSELGGDAMQRTSPYIDKDEDDYGEIAKVEDTENAGNVNMDDPGKSEKVNDIPASQVCSFVGNPLCFKAKNECLQLDLVDTVDGVYPTAFDGNRIKQAVDIEKVLNNYLKVFDKKPQPLVLAKQEQDSIVSVSEVESVVPGDEESSDELSEDNASMDVDDEEFIVDEEEVPYKDDDDFEGAAKANIEGSCGDSQESESKKIKNRTRGETLNLCSSSSSLSLRFSSLD
ncbi:hypothetical protein U1Q18_038197 [Sarracenia purpurea var. burkii]